MMSANSNSDTNFVWTDLSSYDTVASNAFYSAVFGWQMHDMGQMPSGPDDPYGMDQVTYHVATLGDRPAAGIFDMPPFFQKIKMRPFWMSYLAVENLGAIVAAAKAMEGVIVDIEPTPFGDGTMALIRDPLGAGFTCYEGPDINSKGDGGEYGRMVWNELITADIASVEPFYRGVLGLDLIEDSDFQGSRVKLLNRWGEEIAGIQAVDSSIRSEKVYWVPFFSVDGLEAFSSKLAKAGGQLLTRTDYGAAQDSAICFDNTGAAFGVAETGAKPQEQRPWYRMLF